MALPMPREAPVTSATLPASAMDRSSYSYLTGERSFRSGQPLLLPPCPEPRSRPPEPESSPRRSDARSAFASRGDRAVARQPTRTRWRGGRAETRRLSYHPAVPWRAKCYECGQEAGITARVCFGRLRTCRCEPHGARDRRASLRGPQGHRATRQKGFGAAQRPLSHGCAWQVALENLAELLRKYV